MKRLAVPVALALAPYSAIAADPPADSQLKAEFDELSAKATAAIETVRSMEDRARANGQSLHPSLVAQRILIETSMNQAQEALRAKDMDSLREQLKRARAHIDRLYKML